MRRIALALVSTVAFAISLTAAQSRPGKTLDIYVVDTEGGEAMLFVSPSGESVLIDSGNAGGRDTDRIMLAIADAKLTKVDYLLTTHYHSDHVGGMEALAARIPIGTFIDHGPTVEEREQVANFQAMYAALYGKAKHLVVKPGDRVPVAGLDWQIVSSAGQVLKTALPGAGQPNSLCADFKPKDITVDPENGQSVGSVIGFGQFRTVQLGDLLWNKEFDLMCPTNRIGAVDVYLASHHGTDPSGSEVLVHALRPRAAVMENGTRKGGTLQTYTILRSSPGLEDIWQLHWSYTGGLEYNPPGVFIANADDAATVAGLLTAPPRGGNRPAGGAPAPGGGQNHTPAYWIKVSAQSDGSFTIANSRNGFSKTYAAMKK